MRAVQTNFFRPGDRTVPTTLHVDRLFDGRSHRVRQVTTQQQGQTIGSTVVSFHTRTGGDAPSTRASSRHTRSDNRGTV